MNSTDQKKFTIQSFLTDSITIESVTDKLNQIEQWQAYCNSLERLRTWISSLNYLFDNLDHNSWDFSYYDTSDWSDNYIVSVSAFNNRLFYQHRNKTLYDIQYDGFTHTFGEGGDKLENYFLSLREEDKQFITVELLDFLEKVRDLHKQGKL